LRKLSHSQYNCCQNMSGQWRAYFARPVTGGSFQVAVRRPADKKCLGSSSAVGLVWTGRARFAVLHSFYFSCDSSVKFPGVVFPHRDSAQALTQSVPRVWERAPFFFSSVLPWCSALSVLLFPFWSTSGLLFHFRPTFSSTDVFSLHATCVLVRHLCASLNLAFLVSDFDLPLPSCSHYFSSLCLSSS